MKLLDSAIRVFVLAQGTGARWLPLRSVISCPMNSRFQQSGVQGLASGLAPYMLVGRSSPDGTRCATLRLCS